MRSDSRLCADKFRIWVFGFSVLDIGLRVLVFGFSKGFRVQKWWIWVPSGGLPFTCLGGVRLYCN